MLSHDKEQSSGNSGDLAYDAIKADKTRLPLLCCKVIRKAFIIPQHCHVITKACLFLNKGGKYSLYCTVPMCDFKWHAMQSLKTNIPRLLECQSVFVVSLSFVHLQISEDEYDVKKQPLIHS